MPAYGELFILVNPAGKRSLRRLLEGQDIHGTDGVIPAETLAACGFGVEVHTLQGKPYRIMKPTLYDLVRGVKRQTQILYPKDIGYICMRLGVGNGTRIIEAGSGSGSLTVALSWLSGERGHVYTYEARQEFYDLCRQNLAWAGVGHNVTQYLRDIQAGFEQTDADALFLDLRTPWDYLPQATAALKPGGALAFLLPTTDQVSLLLKGMETGPFDAIEVEEILMRAWKPVADRLRPHDRMIAHTGFLIFARLQERSFDFESLKPLGTRERKQRKALDERLGRIENEEKDDLHCGDTSIA
ncbi:MAG: tRNA (adenine-N1)-methyltransferase [Desulfovibrio sp.]|jgi:tRNA (adenine57-N1/adenine58-N1)-methyltransferase|nr:tRNA (adenine-N1)-methyltransferase [Desulfovibrio sp.]